MSSAATGICSGRPLDRQNARLAQQGIRAELKRSKAGRTVSQFAALSSLGIETKPLLYAQRDPRKAGLPTANFEFDYSFGDPQPVQAFARRSLGAVTLIYRANGGPTQSAPTAEWQGGQKDTPATVHHRQMRGVVTGPILSAALGRPGHTPLAPISWFSATGSTQTAIHSRPQGSMTRSVGGLDAQQPRQRRQSGRDLVGDRDKGHPAESAVPAVRELAVEPPERAGRLPSPPRSGDPSSDTDPRWDHLLVEARTAGGAN